MNNASRRRFAAVTSALLVCTFLQARPADADPVRPQRLKQQAGVSISGGYAKAKPATIRTMPAPAPRTPTWPTAGTTTVAVTTASKALSVAGTSSPVSVRSVDKKAKRVAVDVLDRLTVARAHHDVMVRVRPADAAQTGPVRVSINYTGFADAYGADWSDRLRMVSLPACALSTPDSPVCAATPLASTNDGTSVSAAVSLTTTGSVLALAATASGGSGDYQATSLSSSAAWNGGGNSGAFTWTYPMHVPPSLGGPAPAVSLDYSSQAVDGRTSATNNQPSWVGEGFGYEPGFIERRYVGCGDDNDDTARKANNTADSGDQCWGTDNATLSLDGVGGGELIYNATEKLWHTRSDDGVRIERLYGADNGDKGDAGKEAGGAGEHWLVTATNGTKYYFGLNKLPGWTTNAAETKSVFTVPVAGNQSAEPCNKTAFKDSFCDQAWRWNLDWVVDPNGNAESFWYSQESNKYARNLVKTDVLPYIRGGNVTIIKYGQVAASAYTAAPMSVVFQTADRCQSACTDKANWQDTPLDQECTGTTCEQYGPSFFTKRRLATVTTQILKAGATAPTAVERWTLTHTWPDPGDGTRHGMWLSKISHTGWDSKGAATSVPDITLTGVSLDNRVDTALSNGLRPMRWYRMKTIYTETGGTIDVTYKPVDCVAGATPDPATNTKRCFPVRWAPSDLGGAPGKEITDWFHKYVVDNVRESDPTTPAQGYPLSTLTTYKYDTPAWRFTDDDGLTKDKYRTWSQWRGYGLIQVIKGENGDQTRSDTRYFRGMDGDKATKDETVGTKRASVTDSKNKATIVDADDLNGQVRETVVYNGPTGAPVSGTISDPWLGTITATHKIGDVAVNARYIDTAGVWNWTARDGGRTDTWTHSTTEFDKYGMPTAVSDVGDTAKTGDEKCVLTDYARDAGAAWMVSFVSQARTFALTCDDARQAGRVITADEVIGVMRSTYDDKGYGVAPNKGNVTAIQTLDTWNNNTPTFFTSSTTQYDSYGRPLSSTDAQQHKNSTTYTPASGGPLTRVDTKNQLGWTSYVQLDPATGAITLTHDANSRNTESLYDGLGRLIKVWKPGRSSAASDVPNAQYTYSLNNTKASVVQSDTLNAAGKITTTYAFFDSLLRPVQTQTPAATTGMLVADTFYDTAGRVNATYGSYWVDDQPVSNSLWVPNKQTDPLKAAAGRDNILSWSRTIYDGAGRETNKILYSKLAEKWRATTVYGGDHVETYPPNGGTVEAKYVDPLGRTTEIRQFHDRGTTGAYDSTKYTYNAKRQLKTVTNDRGTVWEYGYNLQGLQNYSKDPDHGTTTTTFDKLGQTLTTTDGSNQTLAYAYDALGRKTGLYKDSATGTKLADWTYDTLTGGLGVQATSNRYVDGNLTKPYTSATVTLDAKTGLPTKTAVTIPDTEPGLAGTYAYQTRYTANDTPTLTQMPAIGGTSATALPAESLTTGFDDLGAATTLATSIGASIVPAVSFTEFGEISSIHYANAGGKSLQILNSYEPSTRRLLATEAFRDINPSVVSWKEYAYLDDGDIKSTKETAALAGVETQCWQQDYLQRLTDAWTPSSGDCSAAPSLAGLADTTSSPAPYWTSWSINSAGDRTRQIEHKTPVGVRTTDYAYPAPNDAHPHFATGTTVTGSAGTSTTTRYDVDELGQTTSRPTATNGQQSLTWDAEGHLATQQDLSGSTSYLYDADGNRLITKDPNGKTLYLPGQEVRVDKNNTVQSCTRYLTYAGKTIAQRTKAGLTWLVSDVQNTASISVDATTQQVTVRHLSPYGEQRDGPATWINDKGFLGQTVNDSGLTHLGAREYDATIGRFISVDPLMDPSDPQQMQGYSYANNSPVSFSDVTGLMYPKGEEGGGGGGTGGGTTPTTPTTTTTPTTSSNTSSTSSSAGGGGSTQSGTDNQQDKCSHSWKCRARSWMSNHPNISGFVAGAVVDIACTAAFVETGPVGVVACGAAAGMTASYVHDWAEGGHSDAEISANMIESGIIGGSTAAILPVVGPALSGSVRSLISGGGRQAARTAFNETRDLATEKLLGRELNASAKSAASCAHSFAPSTLVLMADRSTKPISQIADGDLVLATDPTTDTTTKQRVDHRFTNHDTDLTDLTLTTTGNKTTQLHTTQHHPFWSATRNDWVYAADLEPGELLHAEDGSAVVVTHVKNFLGHRTMRDLTVRKIHTYYVMAGDAPVLVHNCNRGGMDFTDAERQKVYDANSAANGGVLKCEYCGRDVVRRPSTSGTPGRPDDAQIDHIEPRVDGGHGGAHNGAVACRRCNRDKSTKPLDVWDGELRDLLDD